MLLTVYLYQIFSFSPALPQVFDLELGILGLEDILIPLLIVDY
jgi:hypothetical protein